MHMSKTLFCHCVVDDGGGVEGECVLCDSGGFRVEGGRLPPLKIKGIVIVVSPITISTKVLSCCVVVQYSTVWYCISF